MKKETKIAKKSKKNKSQVVVLGQATKLTLGAGALGMETGTHRHP
jgi:hypothetical protein